MTETPPTWPGSTPDPWGSPTADPWGRPDPFLYGPPEYWHGRAPSAPGRDGFAIAGLVLGIIPVLGGLLGVVFGLIGRSRASRSGQRGRTMGTVGAGLGSLWLVASVALAVYFVSETPLRDSSGQLVTSGSLSWQQLRSGDCLPRDPGVGARKIRKIPVVPCDSAHLVEVVANVAIPGSYTMSSPDARRVAAGTCRSLLLSYLAVARGKQPGYHVRFFMPELSGTQDPRLVCLALAPRGQEMIESIHLGGPWYEPTSGDPTAPSASAPGTAYGDVSTDDLRPGDCVGSFFAPEAVTSTVPVVACGGKHASEVFDVHAVGSGGYPGDAQVERLVLGRCRKELPVFTHAAAGHTGYSVEYLMPTRDSWSQGLTVGTCLLVDPHHASLVGDARGAGPHH